MSDPVTHSQPVLPSLWARFALLYLLLYVLPWPLSMLPQLEPLLAPFHSLWRYSIGAVAKRLLHMPIELPAAWARAYGDSLASYLCCLCAFLFSLGLAAIWTLLPRLDPPLRFRSAKVPAGIARWLRERRPRASDEAVQIILRYYLAAQMFEYGLGKVINIQFPRLGLERLTQPFGEASPMGLLWAFMGHSPAYTFFAGAAEVLGGLLLLSRRTALLGALILVAVLTNVWMLNLCYDVPVKLHSGHLLLFSLGVVAPHGRRLVDCLFRQRNVASGEMSFRQRHAKPWQLGLKLLLVSMMLCIPANDYWRRAKEQEKAFAASPYVGVYTVEEFAHNGRVLAAAAIEPARWQRVTIGNYGLFTIRDSRDATLHFFVEPVPDQAAIKLFPFRDEEMAPDEAPCVLSVGRPEPSVLQLAGALRGTELRVRLRKLPPPQYLLTQRGFRWVSEYPFNR